MKVGVGEIVGVAEGIGVGVEATRMKKCMSLYRWPPDIEKLPLTSCPWSRFTVIQCVSLNGISINEYVFPLGHETLYHTIREKLSYSLLNTRSYELG